MLNKTQQNILDATLQFLFENIEEEITPSFAIKAFETILDDTLEEAYSLAHRGQFHELYSKETAFKAAGIFDSMKQIQDILKHPYPQNRSTGSPYVGQEPGYAVYEPNGHGNGIEKEPIGLLSLTGRNDNTAEPVTRDDVVQYVITKINDEVHKLTLRKQLHEACELDDLFLVSKLLEEGVDPNANGDYGFRPIHKAAMNGNIDLAKILLKAGADPKQKNIFKDSPLHWAAWMGNVEILDFFISNISDIKLDEINEKGKTALIGAVHGGHIEVVKYLLKKDICPTEAELQESITFGFFNIFELLIQSTQLDVNALNRLLIDAVESSQPEIVKYLLSLGAEVNLKLIEEKNCFFGIDGNSLLHLAVSIHPNRVSPEVIRILIDHGADVNAHTPGEYTPLNSHLRSRSPRHRSIWTKKHDEIAKILLQNHADPNIVNDLGYTALKIFILEYQYTHSVSVLGVTPAQIRHS